MQASLTFAHISASSCPASQHVEGLAVCCMYLTGGIRVSCLACQLVHLSLWLAHDT